MQGNRSEVGKQPMDDNLEQCCTSKLHHPIAFLFEDISLSSRKHQSNRQLLLQKNSCDSARSARSKPLFSSAQVKSISDASFKANFLLPAYLREERGGESVGNDSKDMRSKFGCSLQSYNRSIVLLNIIEFHRVLLVHIRKAKFLLNNISHCCESSFSSNKNLSLLEEHLCTLWGLLSMLADFSNFLGEIELQLNHRIKSINALLSTFMQMIMQCVDTVRCISRKYVTNVYQKRRTDKCDSKILLQLYSFEYQLLNSKLRYGSVEDLNIAVFLIAFSRVLESNLGIEELLEREEKYWLQNTDACFNNDFCNDKAKGLSRLTLNNAYTRNVSDSKPFKAIVPLIPVANNIKFCTTVSHEPTLILRQYLELIKWAYNRNPLKIQKIERVDYVRIPEDVFLSIVYPNLYKELQQGLINKICSLEFTSINDTLTDSTSVVVKPLLRILIHYQDNFENNQVTALSLLVNCGRVYLHWVLNSKDQWSDEKCTQRNISGLIIMHSDLHCLVDMLESVVFVHELANLEAGIVLLSKFMNQLYFQFCFTLAELGEEILHNIDAVTRKICKEFIPRQLFQPNSGTVKIDGVNKYALYITETFLKPISDLLQQGFIKTKVYLVPHIIHHLINSITEYLLDEHVKLNCNSVESLRRDMDYLKYWMSRKDTMDLIGNHTVILPLDCFHRVDIIIETCAQFTQSSLSRGSLTIKTHRNANNKNKDIAKIKLRTKSRLG